MLLNIEVMMLKKRVKRGEKRISKSKKGGMQNARLT